MIQLYAGLAIVSLVGGVCYGGYQYYVTTQNQINSMPMQRGLDGSNRTTPLKFFKKIKKDLKD